MSVEIRETTITPAQGGDVVRLYISDAERESPDASFVLEFRALLPKPKRAMLLEQAQRDAIKIAQDHLSEIRHDVMSRAQSGID